MTHPAAGKLFAVLLDAGSYEEAAEPLRATPVPLDPSFLENLLQTVLLAEGEGDAEAPRWRRAYEFVQEYRYRNPRLDFFAPPAARQFVTAIAALASEDEVLQFVQANSSQIDANVVGALQAYEDFTESPDPEVKRRLSELGRFSIQRQQMRSSHRSPGWYQGFVAALYTSFERREMMAVLEQAKGEIELPLAYTLVSICDELLRAGRLTDGFVDFVKALAMHLTDEAIGGETSIDVGAYLWRFILTLYDPRRSPGEYALTLHNIANAEEKRDNPDSAVRNLARGLELAIESPELRMQLVSRLTALIERGADAAGGAEAYRRAAAVYRQQGLERLPEDHLKWFECAYLLAENILSNRGRTSAELQEARGLLERCRAAWHGTESPQLPAVLDLLGAALLESPGDRSENVEAAIGYLERAAAGFEAVRVEGRSPAIVQNRLGRAYSLRIAGDPRQNFDSAVGCFRAAAAACPADVDLDEYLRSITNLAVVLGRSDAPQDVAEGIRLLETCLEHDTAEQRPLLFATDLLEKANLHLRAAELGAAGERHAALASLETALAVPELQHDEVLRAGLLANYGALVLEMPDLPAEAAGLLRQAVETAEQTGIDRLVAGARFQMGRYLERQGDREAALEHYLAAIEASESEVDAASSQEFRLHVERGTGSLYEAVVTLLIELERHQEALDYLERSKARSLRESIEARAVEPSADVPAALAREYEELFERQQHLQTRSRLLRFARRPASQELADVQRRMPDVDRVMSAADVEVMTNAAQLKRLEPLIAETIRKIRRTDPGFEPLPVVAKLSPQEIGNLLGPGRAVIEFLVGERGIHLFGLTCDRAGELSIRVFSPPGASRPGLEKTTMESWLEPYHRYREAVLDGRPGARKLRQSWRAAIEKIGPRLAVMLEFDRVLEWLAEAEIREIVFVPYQLLHALPLHLLPAGEGRYLCDEFEVSYAPSLGILAHCRSAGTRGRSKAFVAENPDGSLVFSELEVRLIGEFLGEVDLLRTEECRWGPVQSGMAGSEIFHYSGHAYFEPRNPLASALVLADRRLTLGEILASPKMARNSLVVLSACETNQVGRFLPGDEYSGLPGGFLYAGAPTVLGSLWLVEDNAGPLFMEAFYRAFVARGTSSGEAFGEAVKALRTVTAGQILERFDTPDFEADPALGRMLVYCETQDPETRIFGHPEYWAAFSLVGATRTAGENPT